MNDLSAKLKTDLVNLYKDWATFDNSRSAAKVRQALNCIIVKMQQASACIGGSMSGNPDITGQTPIRAAWQMINVVTQECGGVRRPLNDADEMVDILNSWAAAAEHAKTRIPKKFSSAALKLTADRLLSFCEAEGLKCTATITGYAVKELVAIANAAGDKSVTPDAAKKALSATICKRGIIRKKKAPE
jgi:hypothetical protein